MPNAALTQLNATITSCTRCPRLIQHCTHVAGTKRRAYMQDTYWGKPVPNLLPAADDDARLLIVGLAPGAHGANRTGRMFTGDKSGDFLYRTLHAVGFASQPTSTHRDDGLVLCGAAITAAGHCAPPDNKPTPSELANCAGYLTATIDALPRLRVLLTLGKIAHDAVLREYRRRGWVDRLSDGRFEHGAVRFADAPPALPIVCCYHPSQQNTFTGRLTPAMMEHVLQNARRLSAD